MISTNINPSKNDPKIESSDKKINDQQNIALSNDLAQNLSNPAQNSNRQTAIQFLLDLNVTLKEKQQKS